MEDRNERVWKLSCGLASLRHRLPGVLRLLLGGGCYAPRLALLTTLVPLLISDPVWYPEVANWLAVMITFETPELTQTAAFGVLMLLNGSMSKWHPEMITSLQPER